MGSNSFDKKYKGRISAEQHKGYYNHWMFKLESITFNNKETFLNTTVDIKSDSSMIGVTKDYLITLKDSLKKYIDAKTVWVNNKINGNCELLQNLPNLNFTIEDSLFSISMKDFVIGTKIHSCYIPLVYNEDDDKFTIGLGLISLFDSATFDFETHSMTLYSDSILITDKSENINYYRKVTGITLSSILLPSILLLFILAYNWAYFIKEKLVI